MDEPGLGIVLSVLSIVESIIAVCIALSFIHFKYFKSAAMEKIMLELNLITENFADGDAVVKAARFSGLVGGASSVAPIIVVLVSQAYVNPETIMMHTIGIYATLIAIFTQISKVILVAKICSELYKRINQKIKVKL